MVEIDRVNEALSGTGWFVAVQEDEGAWVDTPDGPCHPAVITASSGGDLLSFSPSHTTDELYVAICEHQALMDHQAGLHVQPEFHCATCREEKAGPR